MWVFLYTREVQSPSYQHPDTQSLSPELEVSSVVLCHQWNRTVRFQNGSWHPPPKHSGNHWQAFPQELRCRTSGLAFLQVQVTCCSLSSSLPWDISSPQKPSCPHVVLTTTSKTWPRYLHKCQNKTVAMKIHVIADLYLPFPQQKNWFGHSRQYLTYLQDIYLSFKFD